MRYPWLEEQPGEFLLLSLIVPLPARLTDNQSFVIGDGVQRWYFRIGKTIKEKQLAAVRLEFFEIGRVCVEPRSQRVVERVHVTVEVERQLIEVTTEDPVWRGKRGLR